MKAQFHDIRTNVDIFHEEWYKVALELAEKIQLQESMPRSCNRQVHRDNQPHSNCSEYYSGKVKHKLRVQIHELGVQIYELRV